MTIDKLRVATIVGTRPEIIRLSRVIAVLRRDCSHTLIHTGQNYDRELNQIFFEDLSISPPDVFLEAARETAIQTIAAVFSRVESALRHVNPDAVLVLGDTNSGLSLIVARRLGIPTFHMEAGNRCFDARVPEEINRRLIDHVADINMPYSALARELLLREGLPPDRIIVTGSPLKEVLTYYSHTISSSRALETFGLKEGRFYLVSIHREENVDSSARLRDFIQMLNALATSDGLQLLVSTHPRTRRRLAELGDDFHPLLRFVNPLTFTDYVHLQTKAKVVLSDSGSISEEAAILGFKALNLRDTHERSEAMEEASVMMVGSNFDRVQQAILILESQNLDDASRMRTPLDYQSPNVSEKVSRIIHSYVDFVRRTNR